MSKNWPYGLGSEYLLVLAWGFCTLGIVSMEYVARVIVDFLPSLEFRRLSPTQAFLAGGPENLARRGRIFFGFNH